MSARLIVEVAAGPERTRKVCVDAPGSIWVGRDPGRGLAVPGDETLLAHQFKIEWDGEEVKLATGPDAQGGRSLKEAGVRTVSFRGARVTTATFRPPDWLTAGMTTFLFDVEDRSAPSRADSPARAALDMLRREASPLFAVVDCARDRRIRRALHRSADTYRSLYDGAAAEELDELAPCVVELERGSPLLDWLVLEGWGQRWGIFVATLQGLDVLRRHLRTLLLVTDAETAHQLYFRFFDPRVLGAFLPTSTPRQRSLIIGHCDAIFVEVDGELIRHPAPKEPR